MSQEFGWIAPEERDYSVAKSHDEILSFSRLFGSAAWNLVGTGEKKVVLLHEALTKLCGGKFPINMQTIGSCVGDGYAKGVELLTAVEILLRKEPELWPNFLVSVEWIYGASRVIQGQGRLRNMDGALGSWAQKAVKENGTLLRKIYGAYDLTNYSGQRIKEWGYNKFPYELEVIADEHPVQTTALVTSYEEARDAIANGYPIVVCSNQGFSSKRDSEGFARAQGKWAHCYHPNSWLYSIDIKPIKNISAGDLIYDQEGNICNIEKIEKRVYKGDMIRLNTSSGEHFVTKDHIFLVKTNGSNISHRRFLSYSEGIKYNNSIVEFNMQTIPLEIKDQLIWIAAEDLRKEDILIMPKIKLSKTSSMPSFEGKSKNKIKKISFSKDLFWLFGLYAGDGCADANHKIRITQNINDYKKISRAKTIFKDIFGLDASIIQRKKANAVDIVVYNASLANFMLKWFDKQKNKNFPAWLLIDNKELLESLIEGFCDADGTYISRNKGESRQISNTSEKIINQIYLILTNLGYAPNRWQTVSSGYKKDSISYFISYNTNKQNKEDYYSVKIKNIDKEYYNGEVVSLETSGTHSYICNGVVSHNCMLFASVDDEYKRPGLLCVNSWGEHWIDGPKRHNQPEGSFWVDADDADRMLKQQDSYALSNFKGYPAQEINNNLW
jgi:intein/homing endonuclease